MNKNKNIFSRLKQYCLLILLIVTIYSIPLAINNVYPFGDFSLGIMDFKTQYIPFFTYFRENFLVNPSEFFYSPSMGIGGNLFGLFGYYLSSPLNFILFLFPVDKLELGIYMIIMVKFSLMGIFTSVYLEKYNLKKSMSFLLSFSYALSGYASVNIANPMWLDAMFLLPLMFIAIDKLISKNKLVPFVLVYTIMIYSNFYIAYMIGVLSIIYFIYSYLMLNTEFNLKSFIKSSLLFISGALISLCLTLIHLVTTIHSLWSSKLDDSLHGYSAVFENPLDLFSKLYIGNNGTTQVSYGLPNIFLPSIFISLIILFFTIKTISKREKVLTGSILATFMILFYFPLTNLILHGFSYPLWFQYRYSFFMIFFGIIIASRVFEHINDFSMSKRLLFGIITFYIGMFIYFLVENIDYVLTINMISSTLYMITTAILLYFMQNKYSLKAKIFNKNNLFFIVILISLIEVTQNNLFSSINIYTFSINSDVTESQTYKNKLADVYKDLKDTDKYRTETTFESSYNDNLITGLKGITGFNSTLNSQVSKLIRSLGYSTTTTAYMQNQYIGGTLFTDSILNIKYVLSYDDSEPYDLDEEKKLYNYRENTFKENHHKNINNTIEEYTKKDTPDEEIKLYENDYAIGYGWLQNNNSDFKYSRDIFKNINNVYKSMFDTEDDLYVKKPYEIKIENLEKKEQDGFYKITRKEKESKITLTYDNIDSKNVYINGSVLNALDNRLTNINSNLGILKLNGKELSKPITTLETPLLLTSDKQKGNVLELTIPTSSYLKEFRYLDFMYEVEDKDELKAKLLSIKDTFEVETFENTYIKGTVNSPSDDNNLIMTIPYDSYWSVKVNGKPVEKTKELNALIGIPLEKGINVVEMSYNVKNLKSYIIISLVSVFVLGVYTIRIKEL